MNEFDFVFSLFGLLLGFSLAEVLSGFGRALKARQSVRIGWLTPMLGLFVMLDLISFWNMAWSMRDALSVKYIVLMLSLIIMSIYYLAATLVFPDDPPTRPNFDDHYYDNKRLIVSAIVLVNLPNTAFDFYRGGVYIHDYFGVALSAFYFACLGALWFTRNRLANLILLALLIAVYLIAGLKGVLA